MATSSRAGRVDHEPAFVLHSYPYRETSLIVELLTRSHGRVPVVARGAKRPRSALRSVLLAFQPLQVAWSGQGELRNLIGAEWLGGLPAPRGRALLCGFYVNELLLRLLTRDDPHPALFDGYLRCLGRLAQEGAALEPVLREFEWLLLRETGHGPDLRRDNHGAAIAVQTRYRLAPGGGFEPLAPVAVEGGARAGRATHGVANQGVANQGGANREAYPDTYSEGYADAYDGEVLLALAEGHVEGEACLAQAKQLTRAIISRELNGEPLHTRKILLDLQRL